MEFIMDNLTIFIRKSDWEFSYMMIHACIMANGKMISTMEKVF